MSRGRGILSPLRLPFRHFGATKVTAKLTQHPAPSATNISEEAPICSARRAGVASLWPWTQVSPARTQLRAATQAPAAAPHPSRQVQPPVDEGQRPRTAAAAAPKT